MEFSGTSERTLKLSGTLKKHSGNYREISQSSEISRENKNYPGISKVIRDYTGILKEVSNLLKYPGRKKNYPGIS
jgi:hypothetical protein